MTLLQGLFAESGIEVHPRRGPGKRPISRGDATVRCSKKVTPEFTGRYGSDDPHPLAQRLVRLGPLTFCLFAESGHSTPKQGRVGVVAHVVLLHSVPLHNSAELSR